MRGEKKVRNVDPTKPRQRTMNGNAFFLGEPLSTTSTNSTRKANNTE